MTSHVHDTAQWLIRAISSTLQANNGGEDGVDEALMRLAQQDTSAAALMTPSPRRLPACRFLPDVVASTLLVAPDVAAALAAVEEDLHWAQNPNYSNEAMGQSHYMDNYAYAEIIGPNGAYAGDDFLLGLFLLGPGLNYPNHAHPAPELYWILSGASDWRVRGEEFSPREPGETVWHDPYVPHATNVGAQPLLCAYVWTRDVKQKALLV